jgi:hypothetical protein
MGSSSYSSSSSSSRECGFAEHFRVTDHLLFAHTPWFVDIGTASTLIDDEDEYDSSKDPPPGSWILAPGSSPRTPLYTKAFYPTD